jgi:O-antigen ligase
MLIALVIISELVALFLTNDAIFEGGAIVKVEVALGWGIWNLVGTSLSSLIPIIFYGVHFNKYPWLYFTVATLAWVFSALTMSRNALIFATLAYGTCVIISCFKGKNKRTFRFITLAALLCAVAGVVVLFGKIKLILSDYFERGMSDNGRFELWRAAFDNFRDNFVFGGGFYGFEVPDSILSPFGPLAKQAHNTVLQLLSATGIVGFLSYAYYRFATVKPVFKRPTLSKTFMALSVAVLLGGSLLDNFIFNIYPLFSYTVALSVIHKEASEEKLK